MCAGVWVANYDERASKLCCSACCRFEEATPVLEAVQRRTSLCQNGTTEGQTSKSTNAHDISSGGLDGVA